MEYVMRRLKFTTPLSKCAQLNTNLVFAVLFIVPMKIADWLSKEKGGRGLSQTSLASPPSLTMVKLVEQFTILLNLISILGNLRIEIDKVAAL
jgi:hypothetical protein